MKTRNDNYLALQALRTAGNAGVHSFDLNHIIGTTRAAARINDLKNKGFIITSKPERMGNARGVRYFLHEIKTEWVFDNVNNIAKQVRVG